MQRAIIDFDTIRERYMKLSTKGKTFADDGFSDILDIAEQNDERDEDLQKMKKQFGL